MWWLVYIALSSALLTTGGFLAEGCTCERLHPQQHFCAADYVIGGRILRREYVRINTDTNTDSTDPLPENPHPKPEGLHPLPDESFPEGMRPDPDVLKPLPHPGGVQPLPHPGGLQPLPQPGGLQPLPQPGGLQPLPQPGGLQPHPDGIMPHPGGLQPLPEGLEPGPQLPPLPLPEELVPTDKGMGDKDLLPTASETVTVAASLKATTGITPTSIREVESLNDTAELPIPLDEDKINTQADEPQQRIINPQSMDAWNYKIVYTIELKHVYKASGEEEGEWKVGEEVQLQSPASDGHCGMTSLKNEKTYLIAGRMAGRVRLCDWVQEHHHLTTRQKQGLKKEYGRYCDACQIVACPSRRRCKKPKRNRHTTCMYDASQVHIGGPYSSFDCLGSHSRCTLRGGSKCKWMKNNHYHDCMKRLP